MQTFRNTKNEGKKSEKTLKDFPNPKKKRFYTSEMLTVYEIKLMKEDFEASTKLSREHMKKLYHQFNKHKLSPNTPAKSNIKFK